MLTGNEPVSAGNLRASLGSFSHHRAGAVVLRNESEEYKTGNISGPGDRMAALNISTNAAAGCSFKNGLFIPEKPGIFALSVSCDTFSTGSKGNVTNIDLAFSVGGDNHKFKLVKDGKYKYAETVAIPASGLTFGVLVYVASNYGGSATATMSGLNLSIIEI